MSDPKISLDLSLPAKPALPSSSAASNTTSKTSLLSRIGDLPKGLPVKPAFAAPTSSYSTSAHSRPIYDDLPPPPLSPPYSRRRDDYDTYIPRRSYSPEPFDRDDRYRPRSPPPRRRADWDRRDSYIARSPSPPPSPIPRRAYSHRRTSERPESLSPIKPRSPSPELPKTFYTFSHKKAEEKAAKEEERRIALEARAEERRLKEEARAQAYRQRQAEREAQLAQRRQEEDEQRARHRKSQQDLYGFDTGKNIPTGPSNKRSAASHPAEPPSKTVKQPPSGPRSSHSLLNASAGPRGSIPTGPRSHSGLRGLPTGPRIPTGPRAATGIAAYHSSAENTARKPDPEQFAFSRREAPSDKTRSRSPSPSSARSFGISSPAPSASSSTSSMPSRGGRQAKGRSKNQNKKNRGNASPSSSLTEPLHSEEYIKSAYDGANVAAQVLNTPQLYIELHVKNQTGGMPEYKQHKGTISGGKMYRVTVQVDVDIIGVGDAPTKNEAARLAAMSAALQLNKAGKLPNLNAISEVEESTTLSDGTVVDFEKAREFMDYYCNRWKFGKPDIEFTAATVSPGKRGRRKPKGAVTSWEAVMSVGGRRIGMGTGASKKKAQVQCYLDVTQYLESCDKNLWKQFTEHTAKGGDIGSAPHLAFQMSEQLNEDIYGLCNDIRSSRLYQNAPKQSGLEAITMPSWTTGRQNFASPEELEAKSTELSNKLAAYEQDPSLESMRKSRAALPIMTKAEDILAQIEKDDVNIIMAATGSGKTTQIPQIILDDYIKKGEGAKCNILCTQPRRLAATSVAERVADERGDKVGNEIGYHVRFDVKLPRPNGSVTFCTTGIFLKRMQSSLGENANPDSVRAMDEITHIVVDEVHERDVDIDLTLVVLKRLLADRKARGVPIKLILMSATIDPTLFQNYFKGEGGIPAPVAEVPGRTFPVQRRFLDEIIPTLQKDLRHREGGWVFDEKSVSNYLNKELSGDKALFGPNSGMDLEIPYPLVALTIANVLNSSDDGHVLVFLPGWEEIKKVAGFLLENKGSGSFYGMDFKDSSKYSVHYLHSTIPAAEQKEVFKPPPKGVRRIILATNIAETSVTIPDVVYVVDAGRIKEKRYDPDRRVSSLVTGWVGKSNLNQRAGRAGRHREGEYYGLVSNLRYESLATHQTVEMKRDDLSAVVMHVKALNLGGVEDVLDSVIEPPGADRVKAAMDTLRMMGALDENKNLTSLGRVLLQLPVDPAVGKLLLYGSFFRCLDSALTLAAVLTSRDPFLAPEAIRQQAQDIKDSWSPLAFRSDPLAAVVAYNKWREMDDVGDFDAGRRFCRDNLLSIATMIQIKQLRGALLKSLEQTGVVAVSAGGSVGRIGRRGNIPPQLNSHGQSLPLLAALIALASAPNFAIRFSPKQLRTAQDKSVIIGASSVNSVRREQGGPEEASASFNPAERRLYAFGEKAETVILGGKGSKTKSLRQVTRLDPMTYLLFGAYKVEVTKKGLECDSWLPVVGNLYALDDVQRLKTYLDTCMLRVFEGVGKSLTMGREERRQAARQRVEVNRIGGSSSIKNDAADIDEDSADEREDEADDEEAQETEQEVRKVTPLDFDEIRELELLTTDVVRILDAYAGERESGGASRSPTPAM